MPKRARRALIAATAALGVLGAAAPAADARDGFVTSFDGTKIVYSFFPAHGLKAGEKVPTVMNGPGYSSARSSDTDATVKALLDDGYNVLTWDPRGFGDSGGNVEVDGPDFEARDVQALMDYIQVQPEAQLEKPGDPRLGMIGGSYGGGIQNNSAAIDPRIDVITPDISWHSLITSLNKNHTAKGGWGSALYGLGASMSATAGITGGITNQPAGFQTGRSQDPRITTAFQNGLSTGGFSPEDEAFFASRGPGDLINQVKIPTLITQGTADTLFTLHEGITNYAAQKAAGANVAMIWFCGGHGACLTSQGADPDIVLHSSVRWLDRYLKGNTSVDTGPRFQWVTDTGVLRGAGDYPLPEGAPLTATGSGALPMAAGDTSGALIAAAYAGNALSVPFAKPAAGTQLLGEPTLTITYSGTAANPDARAYAQIVDDVSHNVLGNQVTPIPLVLDGQPHTATFTLEGVAIDAVAGESYTLQITDGTSVYFAARQPGLVTFSKVEARIPTVKAGASTVVTGAPGGAGTGSGSGSAKACTKRRLVFRLRGAHHAPVVRAKLYVNGKLRTRRHGRNLRTLKLAPLTGNHTYKVRIVTVTRTGSVRVSKRTIHGCTKTKPTTKKGGKTAAR